jgi:DUF971 family protein
MNPISIKRTSPAELQITWNDGHISPYPLELLRDICPCAGCAGESVLFESYVPPPPDRTTPGRYEIRAIQQVGSYAMQIEWGDGHNTGIYSWEFLISHCPCPVHSAHQHS